MTYPTTKKTSFGINEEKRLKVKNMKTEQERQYVAVHNVQWNINNSHYNGLIAAGGLLLVVESY